MAESSKIRVVRCPKCGNLLPEFPNFSVYQCGGCGVALKAKKKVTVSEGIEERSKEKESIKDSKKLVTMSDAVSGNLDSSLPQIERNTGKVEKETKFVHEIDQSSKIWTDEWGAGCDYGMNINRCKSVNSRTANRNAESSGQLQNSTEGKTLRVGLNNRGVERECFRRFDEDSRAAVTDRFIYSPLAYPDEGPSNYKPNSFNGYDEPIKRSGYLEDFNLTEFLGKMSELKEQITLMEDKIRREIRPDTKITPPDSYGDRVPYNLEPFGCQRNLPKFKQCRAHASFKDDNMIDVRKAHHPSRHYRSEVLGYHSPYQQCPQPPPYDHYRGRYKHECSCFRCYDQCGQGPPKVSGSHGFSNRRSRYEQIRSNFRHHISPVAFGPQNGESQLFTRCAKNTDSDVDRLTKSRPRKVVAAHPNRQLYRPVAGGAPFITCYHCLELLHLPSKLTKTANTLQKLQCGTCSIVYSFQIKNKTLLISTPKKTNRIYGKDDNGSRNLLHGVPNFEESSKSRMTNSADTKQNLVFEDELLDMRKSEKRQGYKSDSPISTVNEETLEAATLHGDLSNFGQIGSPLSAHSDETSSIISLSSVEKGNKSKRIDQGNLTNIDNNIAVSSKKERRKVKKGHKALLLVGLIKKRFQDTPRSNQNLESERYNVSVNGQLIPDHLVKKAEKFAGRIHPGDYWYDSRAGFWGVMGQPCLGIVTPFIEEFNYPMPENCAAGNTGVLVNGRELHQTDFDILVSRGLPNTRNKKYIIEISGRVVDEDSGKELDSLGQLAPTVESEKRGFGMRVPQLPRE